MSPAMAARRRMLAASTGIRCGALSGSSPRRGSAQAPIAPASTRPATTIEASTTSVTDDRRAAPARGRYGRQWRTEEGTDDGGERLQDHRAGWYQRGVVGEGR